MSLHKPQIDLSIFKSPNPDDNITTAGADQIIAAFAQWEWPFDTVEALPAGAGLQPDPMPYAQLKALNTDPVAEYYIIGRYNGDPDTKFYTIGKEKEFFFESNADTGKTTAKPARDVYADLYAERHPGTSRAQADSAADNLGAVKAARDAVMEQTAALVTL